MDWLGGLGSGIGGLFGGGGGEVAQAASPYAGELAGGSYGPLIGEAAAGAGGAGAGGGGGWWDAMGGIGGLAKAAGTAAQLGSTGMNIWGGIEAMNRGKEQMGVLRQQQKQQQAMAAPAAASGGALTAAGSAALTGGALPPALEAQVEDWKNQSRMRYRQQLAAQGITDSSMAGQMEGWIELQAQKMRGELAGNLYGQGLAGVQTAMGPSVAASQTAMGMAGGTQGSLQAANEALAKLLGSS
jgi:hypothetical protein